MPMKWIQARWNFCQIQIATFIFREFIVSVGFRALLRCRCMDGVDGPVAWQMETSSLRVRDAAVSSAEGGPSVGLFF
jgi:hypothetical protein